MPTDIDGINVVAFFSPRRGIGGTHGAELLAIYIYNSHLTSSLTLIYVLFVRSTSNGLLIWAGFLGVWNLGTYRFGYGKFFSRRYGMITVLDTSGAYASTYHVNSYDIICI
jgi:hypothetical protein